MYVFDEPWQLKVAIDIKTRNVCTGAGDEDAAEVDRLGEGLVLELDRDLFSIFECDVGNDFDHAKVDIPREEAVLSVTFFDRFLTRISVIDDRVCDRV